MPKQRKSVCSKTDNIKVLWETVGGGGVTFSLITNSSSRPILSQMESPVPSASATSLGENIDEVPSSSSNAETAYNTAKRKELSVGESLKDDMLWVSFESSPPSTNLCIIVVFCETCGKNTQIFFPPIGKMEG